MKTFGDPGKVLITFAHKILKNLIVPKKNNINVTVP